jgi:hypothetical protein
MTDGRVFLAIWTVICVGVFLNGLRFARMKSNPWAGKRLFWMRIPAGDWPIERVRLRGVVAMIVAPLVLIFGAAACFGLFGPLRGIQTIKF